MNMLLTATVVENTPINELNELVSHGCVYEDPRFCLIGVIVFIVILFCIARN